MSKAVITYDKDLPRCRLSARHRLALATGPFSVILSQYELDRVHSPVAATECRGARAYPLGADSASGCPFHGVRGRTG